MVARNVVRHKKKASGISKAAKVIADLNAYGQEPTWKVGQVPTNDERARALTWYNRLADKEDLFIYLTMWLEKHGHSDWLRTIKSLPEQKYLNKYLPRTACALARMEDLGAKVEADDFIVSKVKESVEIMGRDRLGSVKETEDGDGGTIETDEEESKANLFRERIKARVWGVRDHLEDQLMEKVHAGFDVYDFLKANNYPVGLVTQLVTKLEPLVGDYEFGIKTGEGFSDGKPVLKTKRDFVVRAIDDCRRYASNEKKLRDVAPRKKKPVSVEKKLRDFRYMKESSELKIASVNPADVIGAKELWHYDTKGNILTVLRSERGLDVNRTTIVGHDPDTSHTKKAGRRPDKWLERVRTDGRVGLRKIMDDMGKDPHELRTRINENILLLKVIR